MRQIVTCPRCLRSAGFFFLFFQLTFFFSLASSERHIALLVHSRFQGELSFAYRIQAACRNIQWKADLIYFQNSQDLHVKEYDFVINLAAGIYEHPKCKNYLAVFHPKHHFFNEPGELKNTFRSYDGYLLTYEPTSFPYPYMLWYPTVQRREYQTVTPLRLFYVCSTWGNRLQNETFQKLLNLLDQEEYTRVYGKKQFHELYPKSYSGEIPFDAESLLECMAQAGVALVLHSSDHNAYGLPSGRIFEAAAASCVIICDQNAFVKKHFGKSVLYINTSENGPSIFSQIQSHMKWIWTHNRNALKMARKAHDIYRNKFLLEDQLLRLESFHQQLCGD